MSAVEQTLTRVQRKKAEARSFRHGLYDLIDAANQYRMPQSREELDEARRMARRKLTEIKEELRSKSPATFPNMNAYLVWRRDANTAKSLTDVHLTFLNRAEKVLNWEYRFGKGVLDLFGSTKE